MAASATSGPAMITEKAAGAIVTSASVNDRKISTSSTMMKIDRQVLDLVALVARGFLLVDLDGHVAGQVHAQPGGQVRLRDLRAQRCRRS